MSFTDNDLKRLKESSASCYGRYMFIQNLLPDTINALLSRLEAAELYNSRLRQYGDDAPITVQAGKAWREAAGKDEK